MIRVSTTRICVGRFYPAEPLVIWDIITDTSKWPQWGPTVKSVRCSESIIRKYSQGHVLTPFGIRLPFVITEYDHLRFWSWRVTFMRATGHRIEALQNGGCNLWFDLPTVAAPYALICQRALGNIDKLL